MDQNVEIPANLIKVETDETLHGYVLVVVDSPEHAYYAAKAAESKKKKPAA